MQGYIDLNVSDRPNDSDGMDVLVSKRRDRALLPPESSRLLRYFSGLIVHQAWLYRPPPLGHLVASFPSLFTYDNKSCVGILVPALPYLAVTIFTSSKD